jgi:hypothetical protein
MIARLWWKEARLFWPIAVVLALATGLGQWLAIRYQAPDARQGFLTLMALGWACLYALSVGAAAFAGEREGGTLVLLDTVPVSRRLLWGGKASFAIVSTLAVAVLFFGIAWLGTERWNIEKYAPGLVATGFAVLLLEAVGWGLFWSSISKSALTAAVLSVGCTGFFALATSLDYYGFSTAQSLSRSAPVGLGLALATILLSAVVMTAPERAALRAPRSSTRWQLRSPVILRPRQVVVPEPASVDAAAESWIRAFRVLLWQTWRESRTLRWLLAGIIWGPLLIGEWSRGFQGYDVMLFTAVLAALIAGVSVFGQENRDRTHRFLANHAARPGLVWLAKLAVWTITLALVGAPLLFAAGTWILWSPGARAADSTVAYIAALLNAIAVGQLCGMAIRRGITAFAVTLVSVFAVLSPQFGLLGAHLLHPAWLLATPLAFLAVSWAWSGDWLLDRPGLARWVRLWLWLFLAFATIGLSYAGSRAWGLPDPGPVLGTGSLATAVGQSLPGSNAAGLYREADRRLVPIQRIEGSPEQPTVAEWLSANKLVLDTIREAVALPRCRFEAFEAKDLFSQMPLPRLVDLARLVAAEARQRQSQGDLAGAWNDVVLLLRMARQVAGDVPLALMRQALQVEREAIGLAMTWSTDPRLTREQLRAALAEYRALPGMTHASDSIRIEASLAERTLDLPVSTLRDRLTEMMSEPKQTIDSWQLVNIDAMTTPWEIVRSRRALRTLLGMAASDADLDPWLRPQREQGPGFPPTIPLLESTPLARQLYPNVEALRLTADDNEVARRALVQILALRSWQLAHKGRFPEKLDDLVPGELDELPVDPHVNRPFRYIWSSGQSLMPLGWIGPAGPSDWNQVQPMNGRRLLYSVGVDRRDDGAGESYGFNSQSYDIVFPLPPSPDAPPPPKPEADGGFPGAGVAPPLCSSEALRTLDPSALGPLARFSLPGQSPHRVEVRRLFDHAVHGASEEDQRGAVVGVFRNQVPEDADSFAELARLELGECGLIAENKPRPAGTSGRGQLVKGQWLGDIHYRRTAEPARREARVEPVSCGFRHDQARLQVACYPLHTAGDVHRAAQGAVFELAV